MIFLLYRMDCNQWTGGSGKGPLLVNISNTCLLMATYHSETQTISIRLRSPSLSTPNHIKRCQSVVSLEWPTVPLPSQITGLDPNMDRLSNLSAAIRRVTLDTGIKITWYYMSVHRGSVTLFVSQRFYRSNLKRRRYFLPMTIGLAFGCLVLDASVCGRWSYRSLGRWGMMAGQKLVFRGHLNIKWEDVHAWQLVSLLHRLIFNMGKTLVWEIVPGWKGVLSLRCPFKTVVFCCEVIVYYFYSYVCFNLICNRKINNLFLYPALIRCFLGYWLFWMLFSTKIKIWTQMTTFGTIYDLKWYRGYRDWDNTAWLGKWLRQWWWDTHVMTWDFTC